MYGHEHEPEEKTHRKNPEHRQCADVDRDIFGDHRSGVLGERHRVRVFRRDPAGVHETARDELARLHAETVVYRFVHAVLYGGRLRGVRDRAVRVPISWAHDQVHEVLFDYRVKYHAGAGVFFSVRSGGVEDAGGVGVCFERGFMCGFFRWKYEGTLNRNDRIFARIFHRSD